MSNINDILADLKAANRQTEDAVETALRHYEREIRMLLLDHGVYIPPNEPSDTGPYASSTTMAGAVRVAHDEWESNVEEPPGNNWRRIDHYIRSDGGSGWSWLDPYTRDGQTAWCGHFLSFVWRSIGIKPEVALKHLPSTYRIAQWAKGTPRAIPLEQIRPGDAVVVGPAKNSPFGAHITLATARPTNGYVETIEGNAKGVLPDGTRKEGVVKQRRPLSADNDRTYRVLFAYRPLKEDFEDV